MPSRLSIFPLPGAILFPGLQLPLHIFEPRYRALVQDSMARDRRIAMIQPRSQEDADGHKPALFDIGCIGKISEVEAMEDGRFNLVLDGLTRFRVVRELACESCEIEVQDLRESEAARDRAAELGIQRVPAVAVDGKLAGCCEQVPIDEEALRAAGVGSP